MNENEQIEEMAREIYEPCIGSCKACEYYLHQCDDVGCMALMGAKKIYDKGYRKVERGEWKWISDTDVMCDRCGKSWSANDNADAGFWKRCPECGADMKSAKDDRKRKD